MKDVLIAATGVLAGILFMFVSAITHERDVIKQCKEKGNSSKAMWTAKIKCEVIED